MNINNQTEYKKLFGTRLFILITVCMIVLAMAVPAFAAENDFAYPSDAPPLGIYEGTFNIIVFVDGMYRNLIFPEAVYFAAINEDGFLSFYGYLNNLLRFQFSSAAPGATSWPGPWQSNTQMSIVASDLVWSTVSFYFRGDDIYFDEPPTIEDSVTDTLPTVLNWIQQTLNALFVEGGALQGLLLLVAVPVAITLVFLGARFIRCVIWGA